jgi:hypothetical protein
MDQVCEILLGKVLSPDNGSKSFVERVDTEVVQSFATFLLKVIEINPVPLVHSVHMPAIMSLFSQTLTYVIVKHLQETCASFVLQLISCVNKVLPAESQMVVINYYD